MAAAVYTGLAARRGGRWPTPCIPIFGYSDSWQLVINTGTTNTQNRDAKALHLKLDELIRALEGPRNKLVNLEEMTDAELTELHERFKRTHERVATENPESTDRAA